jgi:hypothetical protein
MSVALKATLDAVLEETAIALAHRWRLVDDQGQVWCATDRCQRLALMPSLHCAHCLSAHYARRGITAPWCQNREQQR